MRWRIFSVRGTDICLHPATLLFLFYALFAGCLPQVWIALLSIALHEGAHAATSALLGQAPKEIEITPLGAMMRLEDEEALPPLQRCVMLLAGPVVTLLLCFIAFRFTMAGWLARADGRMLFLCNMAILLLNLLPVLPLDGGRLLTLVLSCFFKSHTVRRMMRALGTVIGLAAIGMNLYITWRYGGWNLSLTMAGCFILYSASMATTTHAMAELRRFVDRKIRLENSGSLPAAHVAVLTTQTMRQCVRCLAPRRYTAFWMIEPGTMNHTGMLTEQQVIAAYLEHPEQRLADLCGKEETGR